MKNENLIIEEIIQYNKISKGVDNYGTIRKSKVDYYSKRECF